MKQLNGLTSLRFLAALYVFIYHINEVFPLPTPWWIKNIILAGPLGVNIFFALSGFILVYTYLDKNIQYQKFLYKRLIRLYPVYLFGLFLSLGVDIWFHKISLWNVVLINAFMLQSYFYNLTLIWYGGAWSISTEMFFYLLFPLILSLLVQIESKRILYLILCFILVLSSVPGLLHQYGILSFKLVYAFPPLRICEFIAGMIVGILTFRFNIRPHIVVVIVTFMIAAIYLVYFSPRLIGYVVHNIFVLPAILVLLCLLIRYEISFKPLIYLGKISYSFYIIQCALMFALYFLYEQHKFKSYDLYVVPIAFLANLILGIITYEAIEKPIHLRLNRK